MSRETEKKRLQSILAKKYTEALEECQRDELGKITSDLQKAGDRYSDSVEIGRGGMKKILKVRDRLTDRPLAMAVPLSKEDNGQQEQFLREARITACLQHPNIMPVHEIGIDDHGQPFFTMKLIEGENLGQIIKSIKSGNSEMDIHQMIDIFLKVCDAIAYSHERGIVHLDLKPDNIQVGPYGEVLVCDWGLAKIIYHECQEDILFKNDLDNADLELTLNARGTPGYMAPEQFDKNVPLSKLTDIYCLGSILYSILTLEKPIDDKDLDTVVTKTLVGDVVRPSRRSKQRDIPASLEAICLKAMSVKQQDRYQNVDGIINEINSYQRGFSSKAENASFLTEASLFYKRNNIVLNTVGIFLIILIFSISTFVLQLSASRHHAVTAELQTRVTLKKLQRENEKREEAEAAAFKRWMIQAKANFFQGFFVKSLGDLEAALRYRPESNEVLEFKAESALGQLNFSLYVDTVSQMKTVHKIHERVTKALKDNDVPLHKKYFEAQNLFYLKKYEIPARVLLNKCLTSFPENEKEIFIKNVILSRNPELKSAEILVDMKKKELRINSKNLKSVPYLEGSGLKHIDVSSSGIKNTRFIKGLQLISLNISDIPLGLTGTNELNGIKYVDFSNTGLKGMPRTIGHVIELNISGCEIADYSRLLILKQIKKLTVSKGQVPAEILRELNCDIVYR